jgi:hypothetical protein
MKVIDRRMHFVAKRFNVLDCVTLCAHALTTVRLKVISKRGADLWNIFLRGNKGGGQRWR